MQITVLVEPISGVGFRALGGPPISLEAQGDTRDEALQNLRALIAEKIASGAELVALDVGPIDRGTWARHAGMFRDDPLYDPWQEAISEARGRDDGP